MAAWRGQSPREHFSQALLVFQAEDPMKFPPPQIAIREQHARAGEREGDGEVHRHGALAFIRHGARDEQDLRRRAFHGQIDERRTQGAKGLGKGMALIARRQRSDRRFCRSRASHAGNLRQHPLLKVRLEFDMGRHPVIELIDQRQTHEAGEKPEQRSPAPMVRATPGFCGCAGVARWRIDTTS